MPKGYVIFTEDIRDEAGMNVYAQQAFRRSRKRAAGSSRRTMPPS